MSNFSEITCIVIPSVGIEIDIIVDFTFKPGDRGNTYGPAENCYEGWTGEAEIVAARGYETGLDVMPLLMGETIAVPATPWYVAHQRCLLDQVADEMRELADEGRAGDRLAYWRRLEWQRKAAAAAEAAKGTTWPIAA